MMSKSLSKLLLETDPYNLMSVETAVKNVQLEQLQSMPLSKVYFLSNYTLSGIETFLQFHGLRNNINIQSEAGDYNVIHQALMSENSRLHAFDPGVMVISLMYELMAKPGADDICGQLLELFELAASKFAGAIIINTFIPPLYRHVTSSFASSKYNDIQAANDFIRRFVREKGAGKFFVCDWEQYVQTLGFSEAIDRRYWYMAKAPFKPSFLSLYASDIAKVSRDILGLKKKCLVLDCDGTLWGGVLGEEGIDGINLHPEDYPGNVFFEVQRRLLELQKRGIIFAISSKNNEKDVFDVFENHAHSLLQKKDFSSCRINWNNKAENIISIAEELNLGLDSFVFLDDSNFECNLVADLLPAVSVRQVPSRIYDYPDFLAGIIDEFFFTGLQTNEDSMRAELYLARKKAEEIKADFSDIESYLSSLNMVVDIHEMQASEIARVAQLTHKTNQFNLDKIPYSEEEIRGFHASETDKVYVMEVSDRFGKLGLTNVCIINGVGGQEAYINTFLMSCRVFERNLEFAFLNNILERLKEFGGCNVIKAKYKPTNKNIVAEQFYEKMGFQVESLQEGSKVYKLELASYSARKFDYLNYK